MEKKKIIEKIEKSKNVKVYDCGIYAEYEAEIKRKYSDSRTSEILPDNYLLIVLENEVMKMEKKDVIWRRFVPKGTEEEMAKLDLLIEKKDIKREDLILIFKCLKPIWKNIL